MEGWKLFILISKEKVCKKGMKIHDKGARATSFVLLSYIYGKLWTIKFVISF